MKLKLNPFLMKRNQIKKNKIKQKSSEGQSLSINNQDANVRLEQKEILKEKIDQKSKIIRPQKMIFKK